MSCRAAFRLYKSEHAATAMTGDGAKKFGGRWNPVHPDFHKIESKSSDPVVWDPRLIELSKGV